MTLTVADYLGNVQSLVKKLVVYDPEVLDPLEANNNSIEGIDSDGDGIRDDLQRWINFEAANDPNVQLALKNIARNWSSLMGAADNSIASRDLFLKNQKLSIYLYGVLDNDTRSESLLKVMKFLFFKTEERYQVYLKIQSSIAGVSILPIPTTREERLKILDGI